MATYNFSTLADGQSIAFNPNADVLNFDQATISAAGLTVATEGANIRLTSSDAGNKSVVLQNTAQTQLATANVTFAGGSLLLFGDNSPGTAGDAAANMLNGGTGNDLLQGFGGADTMNGGAGDDTYIVGTGDVISDTSGTDTIITDISFNVSAGIENLTMIGTANINSDGNTLANIIAGNAGNNVVWAGTGADTLTGGAGNDNLNGEAGDDWLDGGTGNDTLNGGGDRDHLVFTSFGAANADTITTFATAWDDIRLDAAAMTALGAAGRFVTGDVRFFSGAGAAGGHDADDRVVYDSSSGRLYYDADGNGNGAGAAQLIGTLTGAPTLVASDLWVFGTAGGGGSGAINGTAGDDSLTGTAGNDTINGLAGNDTLDGNSGNDRLDGGDGDDTLTNNSGSDTLLGGAGNDTYFLGSQGGGIFSDSGGTDTIIATGRGWQLVDGDGIDNLTLRGWSLQSLAATGNSLNNIIRNEGTTQTVWIDGGAGNDSLVGGAQNDIFVFGGNYGSDTADGGGGIDVLLFTGASSALTVDFRFGTVSGGGTGGSGSVSFVNIEEAVGGQFDDLLEGNDLANSLRGGLGSDNLMGLGGNDLLDGGDSFEHPSTDQSRDNLYGDDGDDTLLGQGGDDFLDGGNGNDRLEGGDGDDFLYGQAGNDSMQGGSGNDYFGFVTPDYGNDMVDGGSGNHDTVAFAGTTNPIVADLAAGTITGGGTGSVAVSNVEDVDGTFGADQISGNASANFLRGFAGDDSITGLGGLDSLVGGDGNDTLDGTSPGSAGPGEAHEADTLDGGLGNDTYIVGLNDVILADAGGIDTVQTLDTSWTLDAGLENLILRQSANFDGSSGTGNALNNVIDASSLDHAGTLSGLGGNDTMFSAQNGGTLLGGDGNDELHGTKATLSGGVGNDTLFGAGTNLMRFDVAPGAANADQIVGYAGDGIQFDGNAFTSIGASGQFSATDARFFAGAGASGGHDADDRIIYDSSSGRLYYDADGNGAGAAQLVATLQGAPSLSPLSISVINGAASGAVITGTEGDDHLTAGPGNDTINALGGHDELDGADGNDVLNGGNGDDFVFFSAGSGNYGSDTVDGGAGIDTLFVGTNSAVVVDFNTGTVAGGGTGGSGSIAFVNVEQAIGGAFNDRLTANGNGIRLIGGLGADTLIGGAGNDDLAGGDAFDHGNTDTSADSLSGGAGNDTLNGDAGNDTLDGGAGDDLLIGGRWDGSAEGADSFIGGDGNDTLDGASSAFANIDANVETMAGGLGDDLYIVDNPGDVLSDTGGTDTVHVMNASWTLAAGFENLILDNGEIESAVSGIGNELNNLLDGRSGRLLDGGGDGWHVNLDGRAGNDTLLGSVQEDTLDGGTGNDTLTGNGDTDVFAFSVATGAANADVITDFASGTDTLQVSGVFFDNSGPAGRLVAGDARFYAAAGASAAHDTDDRFIYDTTTGRLYHDADGTGSAPAQLFATLQPGATLVASDIVVAGGPAGEFIQGTDGNDTLTGTSGDDTINGWGGNDVINALDGNDVIDGGTGIDTMNGGAGNDTYYVTAGDVLQDSSGTDTVISDADWTLAIGFENLTFAGTGNWQGQGNNADNVMVGNSGNNYFNSRAGNDTLIGNDGNDYFDVSTGGTSTYGNDSIDGGNGTDTVDFDGYARSGIDARLGLTGNGGATGGGDAGAGTLSMTSIERFIGGGFNDTIAGSDFANYLDGRNGNDFVQGFGGNDTLLGQAGNDTLQGGAGNDTVTGGAGNDTFIFAETPGAANADRLGDFASGTDKIAIDHFAMTAIGATGNFGSGDARFYSAAGAAAGHDADDRMIFNTSTGQLYYDADGSGAGAAQLIATLQTGATLAATDITVI